MSAVDSSQHDAHAVPSPLDVCSRQESVASVPGPSVKDLQRIAGTVLSPSPSRGSSTQDLVLPKVRRTVFEHIKIMHEQCNIRSSMWGRLRGLEI